MAKKETAKKTKKASTKKVTSKKVIEEVADNIIENIKLEKEIEVNSEVMEQLKKVSEEKVDFVIEQDPPMEVINGDPSVIVPSNDIEPKKEDTIEEVAFKETFKNVKLENKKNNRIDRSFGYSWNGIEMDY